MRPQTTPTTGRRLRGTLAVLAAVAMLTAGCGSSDSRTVASTSPSSVKDHEHDDMAGMDMSQMHHRRSGPSETAKMVCEEDSIRDAVKKTFAMTTDPTSSSTWKASQRLFTCRWKVTGGTLLMTVHDATSAKQGKPYFTRLRSSVDDPRTIKGVESFGFPAFETKAGDVVFIKDGKTLHVDATAMPAAALPDGFSRPDVAYSVAAAVIGCWTE